MSSGRVLQPQSSHPLTHARTHPPVTLASATLSRDPAPSDSPSTRSLSLSRHASYDDLPRHQVHPRLNGLTPPPPPNERTAATITTSHRLILLNHPPPCSPPLRGTPFSQSKPLADVLARQNEASVTVKVPPTSLTNLFATRLLSRFLRTNPARPCSRRHLSSRRRRPLQAHTLLANDTGYGVDSASRRGESAARLVRLDPSQSS